VLNDVGQHNDIETMLEGDRANIAEDIVVMQATLPGDLETSR
jgi:hypothetical protein